MNESNSEFELDPAARDEVDGPDETTIEQQVVDCLSHNRPEELAALLRGVDQIGSSALQVLAFMLDGKSEDERIMKSFHPFRIVLQRWKSSRPRKRRTLGFPEDCARRMVEQLKLQNVKVKAAIPMVAEQMGRTASFVRQGYYQKTAKQEAKAGDGG